MSSRGVEIGQAIVAAFNASYAATPRRISQDIVASLVFHTVMKDVLRTQPEWDHAAPVPGAVRIYIMEHPETPGEDGDARDRFWVDYNFQIGIAAKVKTTEVADIAPLKLVSQEVRDYLRQTNEAYSLSIQEGVCETPRVIVDPDPESLRNAKLFISIFDVTFTGARAL